MGNTYTAKELVELAKDAGFGSHLQLKHNDGRVTTIPMRGGNVDKGTANSILKAIGKKDGKS